MSQTTTTNTQAFSEGWYDDEGHWHVREPAADTTEPVPPVTQLPATPPAPTPVTGRENPTAPPAPGVGSVKMSRAEWRARAVPTEGFRGFLYKITGGAVNVGPSKAQIDKLEAEHAAQQAKEQADIDRAARRRDWITRMDRGFKLVRITVAHGKGGMGKTTTTIALGVGFAANCRMQVTAIDGNPDRGNLADRVGKEATNTIRDLIDNLDSINGVNQLRGYLSQSRSRLEVLASDDNATVRRALTEEDYHRVQDVLATYRQCIITDTGTDQTSIVLPAIMERTDVLVVPADVTATGRNFTVETLDLWQETAPHGEQLVKHAVVAVRLPDRPMDDAQLAEAVAPYQARVGAVVFIPFDEHLAVEGGEKGLFDWDALAPATQDAYFALGAAVADQVG